MRAVIVMVVMTVGSFVAGLVAVAVVPDCAGCSDVGTTKQNVRTVIDLLNAYRARHGTYPSSLDALVADGVTDKVPFDPWGNAFAYSVDGELAVVTSRGFGERPDISSNDL